MPSIETIIARQRRDIARRESPIYRALREAYRHAIARLDTDLLAVTTRIEQAIAAGEPVGPSWLAREARYQRLLEQADVEYVRFGGEARGILTQGTRAAAVAGAEDAATLLGTMGVRVASANLPTVATERLVASFAPDSPLNGVLASYGTNGRRVIEQRLTEAVTGGLSPREVAREIAADLGSPGPRARLLALTRTELMRSYRGGTAERYQQVAHLLDGVRWLAAKSSRTCLACLSLDGTTYSIENQPDTQHSCCRCTTVPLVTGAPDPAIETGAEWLARQPDDVQREMMGTAYDAYRSGGVALRDFVGTRNDPRWGRSVYQRSGRDVLTNPGGHYTPPRHTRRATPEPSVTLPPSHPMPFASPLGDTYSPIDLSARTVPQATKLYTGKTGRSWNEYKAGDYESINANLRRGGAMTRADEARMADFKKHKLDQNAILYRGVERDDVVGALFDPLVPGEAIDDRAFVSTSFSETVANRFSGDGFLFRIEAPPNTRYVPLDDRTANEDEIVLPPGTRFFVMDRESGGDGGTRFTVIPLPPGSTKPPDGVDARAYAQKQWSKYRGD